MANSVKINYPQEMQRYFAFLHAHNLWFAIFVSSIRRMENPWIESVVVVRPILQNSAKWILQVIADKYGSFLRRNELKACWWWLIKCCRLLIVYKAKLYRERFTFSASKVKINLKDDDVNLKIYCRTSCIEII